MLEGGGGGQGSNTFQHLNRNASEMITLHNRIWPLHLHNFSSGRFNSTKIAVPKIFRNNNMSLLLMLRCKYRRNRWDTSPWINSDTRWVSTLAFVGDTLPGRHPSFVWTNIIPFQWHTYPKL